MLFKLGTGNAGASQKKQNDNYNVVAKATLLDPVSFCEKQISPFATFFKVGQRVFLETHVVLIFS